MTVSNEGTLSGNIAIWYHDIPITPEVLKSLESEVSKECWRYLIGKMCLSEKNKRGDNKRVQDVYTQITEDFGHAYPSLRRFVTYANAIDHLQKILPDIASDILNGRTRLSMQNTIILAKMEFTEISTVSERVSSESTPVSIIISEQKALRKKPERRGRPRINRTGVPRTTVKDTPTYSPDAEVNTLAYTVPSWVSMVYRVSTCTDFHEVSPASRSKLIEELKRIIAAVDTMLARIMEEE
jgi:hypothetical protein